MIIDGSELSWRALADADADESLTFEFQLPADYASTPAIIIPYSMVSATTGAIVATVQVMALPGDGTGAAVDTDSYDTANTVTDNVPGTASLLETATVTLTNVDSWAAGYYVRILVARDANAGGDSATGDMEFRGSLAFTYAK